MREQVVLGAAVFLEGQKLMARAFRRALSSRLFYHYVDVDDRSPQF